MAKMIFCLNSSSICHTYSLRNSRYLCITKKTVYPKRKTRNIFPHNINQGMI